MFTNKNNNCQNEKTDWLIDSKLLKSIYGRFTKLLALTCKRKRFSIFLLLSILGSPAYANMLGSSIRLEVFRPDLTSPQTTPAVAVVKTPGVEFPNVRNFAKPGKPVAQTYIDISSTSISIGFNNIQSSRFSSENFNGYVLTDVNDSIPNITRVTIDPASTLGLTPSDISFTANKIFINVSGLSYTKNTLAKLNIQFAPVTSSCDGKVATKVGTDGDDVIIGTPNADIISAGHGNDIIYGLGGDDVICGGAGDDTVLGGIGNDKVFGEAGNDTLHGGLGNDVIDEGLGRGNVFGDEGNDQLLGSDGNDFINGSAGDDLLSGGNGKDFCDGDTQAIRDTVNATCEVILNIP